MRKPREAATGRLRRAWAAAGAVLMLVLAGAGCGSGPAGAPVRLVAGPAVAALVDPVHVSVSGLPPAGLVTVQARGLGPARAGSGARAMAVRVQ